MVRAWKKIKNYERWVLIGIVVILIATFSVTGASQTGCESARDSTAEDFAGSFDVTPGRRESVTNDDVLGVHHRFAPIYETPVWGSSLRFASDMQQNRQSQSFTTWMHIVAVRTAQALGYTVGDDELREAVQDMILRIASRPGASPLEQGTRFTPELYDQVLEYLSGTRRSTQGRPMTRSEFETTVREILVKDKYLGDLVALERHTVDRADAFEEWKATRQRVDLAFASVPASQFVPAVEIEEKTRSAIAVQLESLRKLGDAASTVRRLNTYVKTWQTEKGTVPANAEDLVQQEPGKRLFGGKLADDPWGKVYEYEKVGEAGRITSAGPDGKAGTADDITPELVSVLDTLERLHRVAHAANTWRDASKDRRWPAALTDLLRVPEPAPGKPSISPPLTDVQKDGWDRELLWDAAGPTVRSAGPDGASGTEDDLVAGVERDKIRVPLPARLSPFVVEGSKDSWDRPLSILVKGDFPLQFSVRSAGADAVFGDDAVPRNDDDVADGNALDLAGFYNGVKNEHRLPIRREFELLYLIPCLVPDGILTEAWKLFPQWRPSEKEAWDLFRAVQGSIYRVHADEIEDPPDPKKEEATIDPKDPLKGYGAAILKDLRQRGEKGEEGGIQKDAPGWQVPSPACFGEQKELSASAGLPSPEADRLMKLYVEKGWRYVVLRDQFVEKMLEAILTKSREAAESLEKWTKTQTGAKPALVTFQQQLDELKLSEIQPSAEDRAKGGRFVQRFATKPDVPLTREEIEKLPEIGSDELWYVMNSMKDAQYESIPRPIRKGEVRTAIRSIKKHEAADQPLEAVREKLWQPYVAFRALARAERELDRVRAELLKPPETHKPGEPPVAPSKPDGEETLRNLTAAFEAAKKARAFEGDIERTGVFIGSAGRGENARKPAPDATDAEKAALKRRSFVRRRGYAVVGGSDSVGAGSSTVQAGAIARYVVSDPSMRVADKDNATERAYLVVVAAQTDPEPAEFDGKAYGRFVSSKAYDATPEWRLSTTSISDRKGYMLRVLYRLYDDWDAYKQDYRIETNIDLAQPKESRRPR